MAEIPRTIGKYKIQEQIAQGGMGAIYKSVHPELKRTIIIKKMYDKNIQSKNRQDFVRMLFIQTINNFLHFC